MNLSPEATSASQKFEQQWQQAGIEHPELRQFIVTIEPLQIGDLADLIRIDQRERWKRNCFRRAEEYLSEFPQLSLNREAALDIMYSEYLIAEAHGCTPSLLSFLERFPDYRAELMAQIQFHTLTQDSPYDTGDHRTDPVVTTWNRSGTAPSHSPDFTPMSFGRYQLETIQGKGAMGTVYRAYDTTLERVVALKMPHRNELWNEEIEARFFQEARAAAKLNHPNICTVHDAGLIEGRPYLAMELIEGITLAEHVRLQGKLAWRQAVNITLELAYALEAAHQAGVVHRDLKSGNVMVATDGRIVLTDFGLAQITRLDDPRITSYGKILGTPAYSPPEQLEGDLDQIRPASDVYSLGVILFEMLTAKLPHEGNFATVVTKVLTEDAPQPSQFCPEIPLPLDVICAKAMRKDVNLRFQSMREFAEPLQKLLQTPKSDAELPAEGLPTKSSREARLRQGLPRRLIMALFATLFFGISLTGWLVWRFQEMPLPVGSIWKGQFSFAAPLDYQGPVEIEITDRDQNRVRGLYETENRFRWEIFGEIVGKSVTFRFADRKSGENTPDLSESGSLQGRLAQDQLTLTFHDMHDGTTANLQLWRQRSN